MTLPDLEPWVLSKAHLERLDKCDQPQGKAAADHAEESQHQVVMGRRGLVARLAGALGGVADVHHVLA